MKENSTIVLLLMLLLRCTSSIDCWNISQFRLVDTALQDNEKIKIIYVCTGTTANNNLKFYNHIIAVSEKSGDTVNILTSNNNGFEEKDIGQVYNYLAPDNIAAKISQVNPDDLNGSDIKDLEKRSFVKLDKVIKNTAIDSKIYFRFPTVVGAIGKETPAP